MSKNDDIGTISTKLPENATEEYKAERARRGQLASAASGLNESFRYFDAVQVSARLETLLEVLPGFVKDHPEVLANNNSRLALVFAALQR